MRVLLAATALTFGVIAAAHAQQPAAQPAASPLGPDWAVKLGAGIGYVPKFEGADDFKVIFIPVVNVKYKDLFFADATRRAAGVNLLRSGPLRVGPLVKYRGGRDEGDSGSLRGLGSIDESWELGLFAEAQFGQIVVGIDGTQDISEGHDGFVAEVRARYIVPSTGRLHPSFGAGFTWASDKYMNTYFGVSATQAANSGLTAFTAEAGIKDVNINFNLAYDVTPNVEVAGFVGYARLFQDAKDSPIVSERGDENQYRFGVTGAYKF